MSTLEPSARLAATFTLMQRYMHGEVPLADLVAAIRALPPGTSGDFASVIEGGDFTPVIESRLDALWRALGEAEHAG